MPSVSLSAIRLLLVCIVAEVNSFFPASVIDEVINKIDKKFLKNEDIPHRTLSHDEILKQGVIRSTVEYFYEQPNGSILIDLDRSKPNAPTNYTVRQLYRDYHGVWLCGIPFEMVILDLQVNVARVDIDAKTKNNPHSHFDAETFKQSNKLVMDGLRRVYAALDKADYQEARLRSGQVLHTIQDFYSHSNW
jgi:hypothetical protein